MATTQDTRTEERTRIDEKVDRARPVETRTDQTTTAADPYSGIATAHERFGGILGGLWGEYYHRRADRTIAAAPPYTERP